MRYCHKCTEFNSEGNIFCYKCGARLPDVPQGMPRCLTCGREFLGYEKYCVGCGKKLTAKDKRNHPEDLTKR